MLTGPGCILCKILWSGGEWPLGEKKNVDFGGKNEKGERKTEENYVKNRKIGLKNVFFWLSQFFCEGVFQFPLRPQQTYLSEEKINLKRRVE